MSRLHIRLVCILRLTAVLTVTVAAAAGLFAVSATASTDLRERAFAKAAPAPHNDVIVPVRQTPVTNVGPGSARSFDITVEVDSIPSGGGYVKVNTDHNSLMSPPSGSWPYNLYFAPGDPTSKTITITSGNPSADTTVIIGSCESDYDASNSANWQVTSVVTVYP